MTCNVLTRTFNPAGYQLLVLLVYVVTCNSSDIYLLADENNSILSL